MHRGLRVRAFGLRDQPPDVEPVTVERRLQITTSDRRPATNSTCRNAKVRIETIVNPPEVSAPPPEAAAPAMPSAISTGKRLFEMRTSAPSTRLESRPLRPVAIENLRNRRAHRLTDRDVVEVEHHARKERSAERSDGDRLSNPRGQLRFERSPDRIPADTASNKQHDADPEDERSGRR